MRLVWVSLLSCALMGCGAAKNHALSAPRTGSQPTPSAAPAVAAPAQPQALAKGASPAAAGPWIGGGLASEFVVPSGREEAMAVWVDVPDDAKTAHVPTALTLTIDTSGSMRGDKIVHARRAAQAVIDRMADGDIVAIHTFADDARIRVPSTVLTPASRRRIAAVIEELSASGGTNLFDGVKLAEGETWRVPASHSVRRVIVISDGRATVGPSTPDTIAAVAEAGVSRGVQVSSIGVGLDYDEEALNELAIRSSGRLYHLSDTAELGSIVEREIALLDKTIATDAVIELVAAPGVRFGRVRGAHSVSSGGSLARIPLGTLFAGQVRELAIAAFIGHSEDASAELRPIASARLHFKDPTDGGVDRVQEIVLRARPTSDASLLVEHPNDRARSVLSTIEAAEIASGAVAQANSGDFRRAELELARAQAELEASARSAKDQDVRRRLTERAVAMKKTKSSMRAAAAAPPAARAAAVRKSALEANDAALDMYGF